MDSWESDAHTDTHNRKILLWTSANEVLILIIHTENPDWKICYHILFCKGIRVLDINYITWKLCQ